MLQLEHTLKKTIGGIVEETVREFKAKRFDLLYFASGVNDLVKINQLVTL